MSTTIRGYQSFLPMPEGFVPLFDHAGVPVDEDYVRLWLPKAFYRAADGITGGHETDPEDGTLLGSRWYHKQHQIGRTISTSSNLHKHYLTSLRQLSWGTPEADLEFAQHESFWDIINLSDQEAVLGHEAICRVRDAYIAHPSLAELMQDRHVTSLQVHHADLTDELVAHHERWRDLVRIAAQYENSALIIS